MTLLRIACVLAILLVAGTASAETGASVQIGPADHPDSYYLLVNVTEPEPPRAGNAQDDCARDDRPDTAEEGIVRALPPSAGAPLPFLSSGTTDPYVPDCVAVPIDPCSSGLACATSAPVAYASYDVGTGRYYVATAIPHATRSHEETSFAGTSGVSARGDCNTCPPPFL